MKTPCELVSWQQFQDLSRDLAFQILGSGFRPTMIVGIGRGGYMPARMLSDFLGIMNLTTFKIEHYHGGQKSRTAVIQYPLNTNLDGHRVLLVDDVSDSGDTFAAAFKHLAECGKYSELKTATLHHKQVSSYEPDFYAERVVQWRWIIYPWAVTEDISSFIRQISPPLTAATEIQPVLKQDYDIELEIGVIEDILAFMRD